jgi:hypothetical protein
MKTEIKLKIAGIIIRIQSTFALEPHTEEGQKLRFAERFNNFLYNRNQKPHIRIKVEIVDRFPKINNATNIFITYHFQNGKENWRLLKKGNAYIYKSPLEEKKQLMLVNKTFDTITAYLLPKAKKGKVWSVEDIIYDFLQILLINYFALHKKGIFVHSVGVKDLDGKGLLFAGKSGCGKTTTAKLWYNNSKAMVLNDDRIIVRNHQGKFFIYGCPWHGEFSDYLHSKIKPAPLENLFFIYHARDNTVSRISQKQAFRLLYPALFPTFWDKDHLENIVSFSQDLVKGVPCYSLGFKDDKSVIGFVRKLNTAKIPNGH